MTRRECLSRAAAAIGASTVGWWLRANSSAQDAQSSLPDSLERIRNQQSVPALAAAAWVDGKLVAAEAVGHRKIGSQTKVTAADLWHIGSCTKSMTATLAGRLIEEGTLKWDDTIGGILGDAMKVRPEWRDVTLEQLLQHRGGAPGEPPDSLWRAAWKQSGSPTDQRRAFVKGLLSGAPASRPGTQFEYSNQGYSIAGAMIEQRTKAAWEDLLRSRVFDPLEMKSAGFGAPGTGRKLDQPWGHTGDGKLEPKEPGRSADNPPAIGPAGTVHCSISDLARYAGWHAGEGTSPGWRLSLKPETFARLHTPPAGADYACGWTVTDRGWAGGRVLTHNGSNTMWCAVMWVVPLKKAAFVAATNAASKTAFLATDAAASELIRRFLMKE